MLRAVLASVLLAVGAGLAHAHSAVPAPAVFQQPPRLAVSDSDAGERTYAAYPAPTADASYAASFEDGDVDPAAHHTFYYLDHAPPLALTIAAVEAMATPIPALSAGLWASCSCMSDLGFMCPDAGTRPCDNGFTWDTSAIPPGAYWLIAATSDPPYDLYTVADGPVRIAHGGPLPPAVILVRPDGFGTFDESYRLRWLLVGEAPFHVDLAYLSDDEVRAGASYKPIATDVPLTAGPDGSYTYDWDTRALPSAHIYHVRATVRDASGLSTFSDSRAGVTIYHPGSLPDLARAPSDLSLAEPPQAGCEIEGRERRAGSPGAWLLALGLASLIAWLSRRATR